MQKRGTVDHVVRQKKCSYLRQEITFILYKRWATMVLRRPERSVECSDSEKKMSACADQNHAPSLTCVRLEFG